MKSAALLLVLQFCLISYGQFIPAEDIIKVNDLYISEQYGAQLDKLKNIGFSLKENVQDYTLNNINYKAEWAFEMVVKAPWHKTLNPLYNAYNTNSWEFITEERNTFRKINIRFLIYATFSRVLFNSLYHELRKLGAVLGSTSDRIEFNDKSENFALDLENGRVIKLPDKFIAKLEYYDGDALTGPYVRAFFEYHIAKNPLMQPIDEYLRGLEDNKKDSVISIPIINEGKISKVMVSIGGKTISYIIDSGASDMNINASIEKYLKEIGVIRSTDYLPSEKYQLADGSFKEYRRVILNSVKIGDIALESVIANIIEDNGILLLGKSFLNRFSYWKINNDSKTLELRK